MSKRANREGTLYHKKNGSWTCQIMVGYKPDGRRDIRTFSAKTRQGVIQKRNDFLKKREAGLLQAEEFLFEELANLWFNSKDDITITTKEGYRYTLRKLTDHFGQWHLADIKAMHIEQFLKALRKEGVSDSTVSHCRGMLYQIMNYAVANDILLKNPVAFAAKSRSKASNAGKRRDAFTAEEVKALLRSLPNSKIGWSIYLMLCTGLRTQELLGLEPRHIAEDGSKITIEQALVRVKGSVDIGTPKSAKSYRIIPVPESARRYAMMLRNTPDRFIWESPRNPGVPCNPSYFAKLFKQAVASVEDVRVLTPHCCRHTYVSHLQSLGIDLSTIQSLVGHADIDMTKHYLHVQESIRQDAVQRFNDAFFAPYVNA